MELHLLDTVNEITGKTGNGQQTPQNSLAVCELLKGKHGIDTDPAQNLLQRMQAQ